MQNSEKLTKESVGATCVSPEGGRRPPLRPSLKDSSCDKRGVAVFCNAPIFALMGNHLCASEVIIILANDSNISFVIFFIFRWGHACLFFEAGSKVALIAKTCLFRNFGY